MAPECGAGASVWAREWLSDCVYGWRDGVGLAMGMASILLWLVAQLPQVIENIKVGNCEALSPWFLASWLLGDTFNLLGCLLAGDQLPSETYTAFYFICMDLSLIGQYLYYSCKGGVRLNSGVWASNYATFDDEKLRASQTRPEKGTQTQARSGTKARPRAGPAAALLCVSCLLLVQLGPKLGVGPVGGKGLGSGLKMGRRLLGMGLGLTGSLGTEDYRIAQNRKRRLDIWNKLPWLLGSLGTVLLDLTIFGQARRYRSSTSSPIMNERTPLLA
eukprot:jgi/Chlat1/377/Chrsp10S01492